MLPERSLPAGCLRLPASASPVEKNTNENEFQCQLKSQKISPFRENFSIFVITIEIIYIIWFSIPLSARRPYLLRPFGPLRPQPGPPAAGTQPFPKPQKRAAKMLPCSAQTGGETVPHAFSVCPFPPTSLLNRHDRQPCPDRTTPDHPYRLVPHRRGR